MVGLTNNKVISKRAHKESNLSVPNWKKKLELYLCPQDK